MLSSYHLKFGTLLLINNKLKILNMFKRLKFMT